VIGRAVDNLNLNIVTEPQRFPVLGNFIAHHYSPAVPGAAAGAWPGFSRYDWGGAKLDISRLEVPDRLLDQRLAVIAGEHGAYTLLDKDGDTLVEGQVGHVVDSHGVSMQVDSMLAHPGTRFDVVRRREMTTIIQLQKQIIAQEQPKDSGIIEVDYDNANPKLATELLGQITQLYVSQNVNRNAAEADSSLKFVQEQLPKVRRDLENSTAALNAFQRRAHSVDISMQTQGLLNQEVQLGTSIEQLRLQQADMERKFTPRHPAYQALMQQISQLEAKKSGIEKQVGTLPNTQQELLRLNRDVQVNNQTYTGLLNQAQQLDIARAGTVGNVRIVDKAAVDITRPVWPKKLFVVVGGTFIGAFLAVVYLIIRQMLNRAVEDPAAIEQLG
ncbi:MAG: GNVR domain-containing protein, partial [Pseudomonas sp.]